MIDNFGRTITESPPGTFSVPGMSIGGISQQAALAVFNVHPPSDWLPPLADQVIALCAGVDQICADKINNGFVYGGHPYQSDPTSISRMQSAASIAVAAIGHGSPVGNLRWANPNEDFGWIDSNNVVVPMDAQTMISFFGSAIGVGQALIFYARSVKDQLAATTDQASLDAIDISAGWPF
jgi:hypothetical protein